MCIEAQMVDALKDIVLSDFGTGDSTQTYSHYIWVMKLHIRHTNILNSVRKIDGEEMRSGTLGISQLDDKSLFSSRTEKEPLLVCTTSQYVWNLIKHDPLHTLYFHKSGRVILREISGLHQ